MSDNFSVEDILKEVKGITGDKYISGQTVSNSQKTEEKSETVDNSQTTIFTVDESLNEGSEKAKTVTSSTVEEIKDDSVENTPAEITQDKPVVEESFDKTMVFDKKEVQKAAEKQDYEEKLREMFDIVETKTQEPKDEEETTSSEAEDEIKVEEIEELEEIEEVATEMASESESEEIELNAVPLKHTHTPQHLLSADEIKGGFKEDKPSFRFNDIIIDLTKQKPEQKTDVVKEISEVVESIEEKYIEEEKEKQQPDVLTNETEENPHLEEIKVEKTQKPIEEISSNSANRFVRKQSRCIFERDFDYSQEEPATDEEEINDYSSIEDEEPVRQDLELTFKKVSKRLSLNVITLLIGFVLTVLPSITDGFLGVISPENNFTAFMVVNAIVLFFALLINISSFFTGLGVLFKGTPSIDSPISVASLFVIAQAVIAFVPSLSANAVALPFYTSALIFAYVLNLMGKKAMIVRIKSNFRQVATTAVKKSGFIADERMGEMLENDDFIGTPYVAAAKSVLNLQKFLQHSYSDDPSDNISSVFTPVSLIAAVVTFLFTYFSSKDVAASFAYATAVVLLATPASVVLAVNSPFKKASLNFRQKDGLISGYDAIDLFSDIDCVAIPAEELFPAGSVQVKSLRAVGDIPVHNLLLNAAALSIGAGGPLADVFYKIIDGRKKMLPEVTDIVYEDELGLTGKIEGKIVRIGNRQFIDSYGIFGLTDEESEKEAKSQGEFVVYIAIEDEVCGMFILKYKSIDPDIEDAVYDCVRNGITLAVKSNDPNITPELVERVFQVPKEYVSVMQAHAAEHYDEMTRPVKNGDSLIAYGGNSTVFASLLLACRKLKTKISVAVIIQIVLTILGFAVCMFTAFSGGGFENISALHLIGYQAVVAVLSILIPSFVKRIK